MQLALPLLIFSGLGWFLGAEPQPKIVVELDDEDASKSRATLIKGTREPFAFSVGLGRKGVTKKGQAFQPGRSLLGRFRINAVLSKDRFEMDATLVEKSGYTVAWLRENLFRNMSSIDFDGDGQGGEYGGGFISLEVVGSEAEQPFAFGEYQGTFRWYSYALHGTQDEKRIGQKSTGGCINIGADALQRLLVAVKLGDEVLIRLRR